MSPSTAERVAVGTRLHGLPVGAPQSAGGNAPLRLDDHDGAWLVVHGTVHVFAAPVDAQAGDGAREFLFHVEAGGLVFGVGGAGARVASGAQASSAVVLLAVGDVDTVVAPVVRDELVAALASAHGTERASIRARLVAYASRTRAALWPEASGMAFDADRITVAGDPLAEVLRLANDVDAGLSPWPALDALHGSVRRRAAQRVHEHDAVRLARLDARRSADAAAESQAMARLTTLFARGRAAAGGGTGSALREALQLVGSAVGVTFDPGAFAADASASGVAAPAAFARPFGGLAERARHIALRSSVGCRAVRLDAGWWTRDAGPLLAFTRRPGRPSGDAAPDTPHDTSPDTPRDTAPGTPRDIERDTPPSRERPLVLLPAPTGGYDVVDPVSGARTRADATLAAGLASHALQFYRALPTPPVRARVVWQFLAQGLRRDARSLVVAGLAAALLGFAPPLLTRALFDHVIPAADVAGLTAVLLALLVASASGLLFDWVRAVAVLRVHVRAVHDLQLAVFDRLLRLPVAFFRRFAAGDLGRRAMGIMAIGEMLGQATLSTLLAGIAGSAALVLLFWYSVPLALLSVALLGVNVALSTIVARRTMPHARDRQRAAGELSALMLETLRGMAKLRVAAAESRLVARWSEPFRRQQQAAFAVDRLAVHHSALLAVLDVLSRVALFGSYAWLWAEQRAPLSTGAFVAFAAAEGTFRASVLSIATTLVSLLELLPEWERAAPVLQAVPETADARPDPGPLTGHIELRRVHFAYDPDGPDVLEDVSLTIPAGQFVAIVGPSGSGKSTLLRLLLGFDVPRRGTICYDGQDLQLVDRLAVRRQLGVVLQHASLSHGDIYSNVTGSTPRPPDAVWEALRLAGIEDEVRAMPMGLMTLIPDGGSSLSGGQRQRLLIARALIHRPAILLFDEATSALDSRAQRCVRESVATLNATRVVIAHRLSTVREADVIVVLDRGRIVESGAYDELIAQGGVFARLAAQQEA